jgi:hypothetical protein
LINQRGIIDYTGSMNNSPEGNFRFDQRKYILEVRSLGNVHLRNNDIGSIRFQLIDCFLDFFSGWPSSKQNQMSRSPLNHPMGKLQTQSTKPASYTISRIRPDRNLSNSLPLIDNDFPDMLCLGHKTKCQLNIVDRKNLEWKRLQSSLSETLNQFMKHRLNKFRGLQANVTEKNYVIRDIRINLSHFFFIPEVCFAEFKEAARFG